MTAFDLGGPLPAGTQLIEASAGTGKTYAIVGLAVRYLAERYNDPDPVNLGAGFVQTSVDRLLVRSTSV